MEFLVKSELLEAFKDIRASNFKDGDKLIERFRLLIFKFSFHFLMVAKYAIVICRLIKVFNDSTIKILNIDNLIAIEVTLNILDDLLKNASGQI